MRLLEALLLAMLMLLCRGAEGAGAATAAQSNETKAAAGSEETTGTSSAPLPGQSDLPAQTPDASETVITGWVHDRASVSRPADDVAGDVDLRVPHDLLVNTATFYVQLSHRRDRRTAFVASGVLSHRQRLRDAQRPIRPSGRGNYDLDTDLLEAYVGLYRGVVDVTLGQQRIPWGRNELFGINDVINARDLRDPLLVPEELRYRPTPAARVDVRLQDVSLQLAWMPFLVPHRFEFYGTNWAVVQDDAPPALRAVLNQAADSRQAGSLFALGESPEDLSHSQLAARLAWNWRDSEVNTYYRYGPDPTPLWSYDQKLLRQLLDPALGTAAAAQTVAFAAFADSVRTSYKRGHHLGMSVVAPVGAFVLYAEGAYETARAFITADRESLARPMTAVVVGVAYRARPHRGRRPRLRISARARAAEDRVPPLVRARQPVVGALVAMGAGLELFAASAWDRVRGPAIGERPTGGELLEQPSVVGRWIADACGQRSLVRRLLPREHGALPRPPLPAVITRRCRCSTQADTRRRFYE